MAENEAHIRNSSESQFDIKEFLYTCLKNWYWFALSVIVAVAAAVLFILSSVPTYQRTEQLIISESQSGGSFGDLSGLSDMGVFKTSMKVADEVRAISSYTTMSEVVKRLHLEMNYYGKGRFHNDVLYVVNQPVEVNFVHPRDLAVRFDLRLEDSRAILSNFMIKGEIVEKEKVVTGLLGDTLSTPVGRLVVSPTCVYESLKDDINDMIVEKTTIHAAASHYCNTMDAAIVEKQSSVIRISVVDPSIARAEDILNTVVGVYKEKWMNDKNRMAQSASLFIDDRLAMVEEQLTGVDDEISDYKSSNLMPDVLEASHMYMSESYRLNAERQNLENQLYMAKYIKNYLDTTGDESQLLPAGSGLNNPTVEKSIADYNAALLRRNNILASSSATNPVIVDIDKELASLRKSIQGSIDYQVLALNTQLDAIKSNERETDSKIAQNPTQEKYLMTIERRQKVLEAIYLFLLEKREGNILSQAFTAYNTRVIDSPNGSNNPVSPSLMKIMLIALFIGFVIPLGVIYLVTILETTIKDKKDLAGLSIPLLGEIPMSNNKRVKRVALRRRRHADHVEGVVKPKSRNIINEAFRVLRTNIEFVTNENASNVLMVTSYNVGSGKSFISVNASRSLAIKGKKVLAIDGDMRHASLSTYSGVKGQGFSDYLGGRLDDVHEVIVPDKDIEGFFLLPVGTIPPNPTELISSEKFSQTINMLRNEYDYIIIDCPPLDMLADAQIVEKSVDRTIVVLRAGLFEKSLLGELEAAYNDGKLKNMSILLNGTVPAGAGHYGRGYGYSYGKYYGHYYGSSDE